MLMTSPPEINDSFALPRKISRTSRSKLSSPMVHYDLMIFGSKDIKPQGVASFKWLLSMKIRATLSGFNLCSKAQIHSTLSFAR